MTTSKLSQKDEPGRGPNQPPGTTIMNIELPMDSRRCQTQPEVDMKPTSMTFDILAAINFERYLNWLDRRGVRLVETISLEVQ